MGHRLHDSILEKHGDFLSRDLLLAYFRDELDAGERHRVEAYLVDNDFDFEALEGFEEVKDVQLRLSQTDHMIDQVIKSQRPQSTMRYYYLAAGIAALIALGFFVIKPALEGRGTLVSEKSGNEQLAEPQKQHQRPKKEPATGVMDQDNAGTQSHRSVGSTVAAQGEKGTKRKTSRDLPILEREKSAIGMATGEAEEEVVSMEEANEPPVEMPNNGGEEMTQGFLDPDMATAADEAIDSRDETPAFSLSADSISKHGEVMAAGIPTETSRKPASEYWAYDYENAKLKRRKERDKGQKLEESPAVDALVDAKKESRGRDIPYMINVKGVDYLIVDYSTAYEAPSDDRPQTGVEAKYKNDQDKAQKEELADGSIQEAPYEAFLKQAMTARIEKRYSDAETAFRNILSQFPGDQNAAFYGGLNYMEWEKYRDAIAYFDLVLNSSNPTFFPDARWFKALCLEMSGQKEAARKLFTRIASDGDFYQERALRKLRNKQD